MKTTRRLLLAGVALALLASLGVAVARSKPYAPALSYHSLDGRAFNSGSLHGKPYLVSFWATSCTGCVAEMPQLSALYQRLRPSGFEVLAVSVQYDPVDYVQRFSTARQLPFPVVPDSDGMIAKLHGGVTLTPTAVLVDGQGRVVQRYLGEPDFAELEATVRHLQHAA